VLLAFASTQKKNSAAHQQPKKKNGKNRTPPPFSPASLQAPLLHAQMKEEKEKIRTRMAPLKSK
jgi:hypothetical protein